MRIRTVKSLVAVIAIALTPVGLGGCAALQQAVPYLQDAVEVAQDAGSVLAFISNLVQAFFTASPNPALSAQIGSAIGTAELALSAAVQAVDGVVNLSAEQEDAAFANFRAAYTQIVNLLTQNGVLGAGAKAGVASPPVLPVPLVMKRHAALVAVGKAAGL